MRVAWPSKYGLMQNNRESCYDLKWLIERPLTGAASCTPEREAVMLMPRVRQVMQMVDLESLSQNSDELLALNI